MHTTDPWTNLRRYTAARIALGRAGVSLPTAEHLTFQMHHARAIDAVYAEMDVERIQADLSANAIDSIVIETQAGDRQHYLQRPDRGRRLSDASRERLQTASAHTKPEVVIAIVDGLSAMAVNRHAAAVVLALQQRLARSGHTLGIVPIVQRGRVALQDEIGAILGAKVVVSLIGERPGLGSPDSLGAYLVFGPRLGNTDANRNCVSNIRPEGLAYEPAADAIHWLITESLRRKISGVQLKDDRQLIAPTQAIER